MNEWSAAVLIEIISLSILISHVFPVSVQEA
jgi:hypothetical protein